MELEKVLCRNPIFSCNPLIFFIRYEGDPLSPKSKNSDKFFSSLLFPSATAVSPKGEAAKV